MMILGVRWRSTLGSPLASVLSRYNTIALKFKLQQHLFTYWLFSFRPHLIVPERGEKVDTVGNRQSFLINEMNNLSFSGEKEDPFNSRALDLSFWTGMSGTKRAELTS